MVQPGLVVLLSSGEAAASGRRVYEWLFRRLPVPPHVAVMETPAGFQPNSALVAEKVAGFIRHHLSNHEPQVVVVPARKRGTPFGTDNPDIVASVRNADAILLGPGSPTYAVRQLQDSLAWQTIQARHRLGAALILASAATIAAGELALPVYEIYKVGEDLHWSPGLNLFGAFGLRLVLISHWDNTEGGADLDTSRGFLGRSRFSELRGMLPPQIRVVGLDEHTALIIDIQAKICHVMGRGGVCLCFEGLERRFEHGQSFPTSELGTVRSPDLQEGIPTAVWQLAQRQHGSEQSGIATQPAPAVIALVQEREAARTHRDWAAADALRRRIASFGWFVRDTPAGPALSQQAERSEPE